MDDLFFFENVIILDGYFDKQFDKWFVVNNYWQIFFDFGLSL